MEIVSNWRITLTDRIVRTAIGGEDVNVFALGAATAKRFAWWGRANCSWMNGATAILRLLQEHNIPVVQPFES